VTVHYTGWQASDGKKFDSSVDRDKPLTFVLNRVIKGWIEGLQQMRVGEKTRFWIPAHLAYGDKGHAGRPSGTLIFDIELLDILDVPKEIKTPNMAIPKRAKTTASGLTYKVLKRGKGKRHPETTDTVKVHYTGWQASDGRQFDSSETRGQPAILPLSRVIKGWTEGLQRMVVGERTRFWIPSHLAYGDSSRSLQVKGMLVFEIELLEIL